MSDSIAILSPAKVNLYLEVLRKREDGYHDIETVFQEITLADEIFLEKISSGIEIVSENPDIPRGPSNLAFSAAQAFFEASKIKKGVRIRIQKNIPVAAGLGGGSSNAAWTLQGLERLFQMRLPPEKSFQIAQSLGADVPFFLTGGTALGRGIGDILEEVKGVKPFSLVLVNPRFKVPTPEVYGKLNLTLTQGAGDLKIVLGALKEGRLGDLASNLLNRLEDVVLKKFPPLVSMKEMLRRAGAVGSLLSGSGPTLFGLAPSQTSACEIRKIIQSEFPECWTCVCETRVGR
ncbi:MAG: 4-(cytidine 5'-diphospho)-2-C-methyl-D-erythritol kinase [Chlamydiae bacterium]|nr:4-(cytidine 5'-diphospho)-2-C-methyl-D-erythritol kinase [Chlamydiota bacterium]MBI3266192.1 4-(cytidine 5'-diphospho)-2-C-methyl-D-erythritol kinase [Chlamydiota bacterium]